MERHYQVANGTEQVKKGTERIFGGSTVDPGTCKALRTKAGEK